MRNRRYRRPRTGHRHSYLITRAEANSSGGVPRSLSDDWQIVPRPDRWAKFRHESISLPSNFGSKLAVRPTLFRTRTEMRATPRALRRPAIGLSGEKYVRKWDLDCAPPRALASAMTWQDSSSSCCWSGLCMPISAQFSWHRACRGECGREKSAPLSHAQPTEATDEKRVSRRQLRQCR